MAKQFGLGLGLRVLFYAMVAWWMMSKLTVSMMTVPLNVFGPITNFLALPKLASGYLSAPALFTVSFLAFNNLAKTFTK
ncbi:hypothetical protein PSACC_02967 [Paramicrosporidium saccamoebae]|uniref:Uncharacterized protein n=1 Tax=Paramicrosporidium saccamoebae TaxID=1246581 RepID=A0A2H9THI1_9FUNG|nr:hypothetical protein PSACC_02967 [Paramicrosporidium saccamoebae]